jgi:hypothetical protein
MAAATASHAPSRRDAPRALVPTRRNLVPRQGPDPPVTRARGAVRDRPDVLGADPRRSAPRA